MVPADVLRTSVMRPWAPFARGPYRVHPAAFVVLLTEVDVLIEASVAKKHGPMHVCIHVSFDIGYEGASQFARMLR